MDLPVVLLFLSPKVTFLVSDFGEWNFCKKVKKKIKQTNIRIHIIGQLGYLVPPPKEFLLAVFLPFYKQSLIHSTLLFLLCTEDFCVRSKNEYERSDFQPLSFLLTSIYVKHRT